MKPFLILSPARSGTAWMSQWLTYGNVHCHHELFGEPWVRSATDVASALQADHSRMVMGNADCANAWFVRQLKAAIPDLVLIAVTRDPVDVLRSLRRAMPPTFAPIDPGTGYDPLLGAVYDFDVRLHEVIEEYRLHSVDFDDLFTGPPGSVRSLFAAKHVWGLATNDEPFNTERWLTMRRFNIQLTPEALEEIALVRAPAMLPLWETRDPLWE